MQINEDSHFYFRQIADELEAIAETMHARHDDDRQLAARLKQFARQIRADSDLGPTAKREELAEGRRPDGPTDQ